MIDSRETARKGDDEGQKQGNAALSYALFVYIVESNWGLIVILIQSGDNNTTRILYRVLENLKRFFHSDEKYKYKNINAFN